MPNLSHRHKLCRHASQQLAQPLAGKHGQHAVLKLPGLLQTKRCFGCDGCLRCLAPRHTHADLSQLQVFGPCEHHLQALHDQFLPAMSPSPFELACAAALEHGPQAVEVCRASGASQRLPQASQLQAMASDADVDLLLSACSGFA